MTPAARTVDCPYCGAAPGELCRVPATGRALVGRTEGHSSRTTAYRRLVERADAERRRRAE